MTSYYLYANVDVSLRLTYDEPPTKKQLKEALEAMLADSIECGYYIDSSDDYDKPDFQEYRLNYKKSK